MHCQVCTIWLTLRGMSQIKVGVNQFSEITLLLPERKGREPKQPTRANHNQAGCVLDHTGCAMSAHLPRLKLGLRSLSCS